MPKFSLKSDESVAEILFENNITLAISTYQAGRVILLSSRNGKTITQVPFPSKKPMGIAAEQDRLAVALLDNVQVYSRILKERGAKPEGLEKFDTIYTPRATYITGKLDLHDLEFGKGGLWAVNTRFSCLCTFDEVNSFKPVWKPHFITALAGTDKCHLNGLAMKDGLPSIVTALGTGDKGGSWRENIISGGVLIDVNENKILLDGLAMPHSPRMINGDLYFLQSAVGKLMKYDLKAGTSECVLEINAFLRGLSFFKNFLFVGISMARKSSKTFNKLPVTDLRKHAGILVYDLEKGKALGEIKYEETVEEIFDVKVIPEMSHGALLPFIDKRSFQNVTIKGTTFWQSEQE